LIFRGESDRFLVFGIYVIYKHPGKVVRCESFLCD